MYGMYETSIERQNEDITIIAKIHGIDMDKEGHRKEEATTFQKQPKGQELPIFGDPDQYKDMSQEEKKKKTQEMMFSHKAWQGNKDTVLGS